MIQGKNEINIFFLKKFKLKKIVKKYKNQKKNRKKINSKKLGKFEWCMGCLSLLNNINNKLGKKINKSCS